MKFQSTVLIFEAHNKAIMWPKPPCSEYFAEKSCHDGNFVVTGVVMRSDNEVGIKTTLWFQYLRNIITLTPYMVLPLFATRFADCAGGIRVSFIEPHLV